MIDGKYYKNYFRDENQDKFFKKKSDYFNNSPVVVENVFLHVSTGTLYKPKIGILSQSKIGPDRIKRTGLIGAKAPLKRKVLNLSTGSSIYCNSANGEFYHWLIECIPRLENIPQYIYIYLPYLTKLNREILFFFEIDEKRIKEVDDRWIYFEKFYLTPFIALPGKGLFLKSFREFILGKIYKKREKNPIIYISRTSAKKRRILNEKDLIINVLEKYNVSIFRLEEFPFHEQLEIIHSAKIIIAPHGAGLSNLIAAPPNCNVYEIISNQDRPMLFYSSLCKSLNLNYEKLLIENPVGRYDDFVLSDNDLASVEQFINNNIQ